MWQSELPANAGKCPPGGKIMPCFEPLRCSSQDLYMLCSLTSLRYLPKCHTVGEATPSHPIKTSSHSVPCWTPTGHLELIYLLHISPCLLSHLIHFAFLILLVFVSPPPLKNLSPVCVSLLVIYLHYSSFIVSVLVSPSHFTLFPSLTPKCQKLLYSSLNHENEKTLSCSQFLIASLLQMMVWNWLHDQSCGFFLSLSISCCFSLASIPTVVPEHLRPVSYDIWLLHLFFLAWNALTLSFQQEHILPILHVSPYIDFLINPSLNLM